MCRVLGCVASEPVSLRHELVEGDNPMIRQSEEHDSGWGMAVYRAAEGDEPHCMRFPEAAHTDGDFAAATAARGRIFNVHVRRATVGGLDALNTHPFCLGNYSFSHNGTIVDFPRLREPGVAAVRGATDSEHFFNLLMRDYDPARPVDSLRHAVATTIRRSAMSGLNFLFSDGERLYAYRLGMLELHWRRLPGRLLVASECIGDEADWHSVQQDVLLTLDPLDPEEPHAERLVGDDQLRLALIVDFADGEHLRGAARGAFAARQAERLIAATGE
jgi:predicted glutamine amidotransferase